MALTEDPYGGALDLNPRRPIEMGRQLVIGLVRSIESTALGAVLHPRLDGQRQRLRNPFWLAWCPVDCQACQTSRMIVLQPQPHSRAMAP
jgi:hypothetical protein